MKHTFKALILAAGLGTRLRPITNTIPKCLISVAGTPLLGRWLFELESLGCQSALINTHYLAEQVESFANKWQNSKMFIHTIHEPKLLGTAGTLLTNQKFFKGSTGLLMHADNATNADLRGLLKAHQDRPSCCLLTMLTFQSTNPSSCGIVTTDKNGIVTSFHEKVKDPPGNRANGAMYLFESEFLEWLNKEVPYASDFSTEVLPKLIGRIQTWHTTSPYLDIGTEESLANSQELIKPVKISNSLQ